MSERIAHSNPCVSCGACCAHFRVQFYWREANREDHSPTVPSGLFEDLTPTLRCMAGTNAKHHPQCQALRGKIGRDAHCSIYSNRPTPCREFRASFEDGRHQPRCDEARAKHGLSPLKREDWPRATQDLSVSAESLECHSEALARVPRV